jgi:hypothetical protein
MDNVTPILECHFCGLEIRYRDGLLLLQPVPNRENKVDQCSVSCNRCLSRVKGDLTRVQDFPLSLLADTGLLTMDDLREAYNLTPDACDQLDATEMATATQKYPKPEAIY